MYAPVVGDVDVQAVGPDQLDAVRILFDGERATAIAGAWHSVRPAADSRLAGTAVAIGAGWSDDHG
jgi:hypothetical protein